MDTRDGAVPVVVCLMMRQSETWDRVDSVVSWETFLSTSLSNELAYNMSFLCDFSNRGKTCGGIVGVYSVNWSLLRGGCWSCHLDCPAMIDPGQLSTCLRHRRNQQTKLLRTTLVQILELKFIKGKNDE